MYRHICTHYIKVTWWHWIPICLLLEWPQFFVQSIYYLLRWSNTKSILFLPHPTQSSVCEISYGTYLAKQKRISVSLSGAKRSRSTLICQVIISHCVIRNPNFTGFVGITIINRPTTKFSSTQNEAAAFIWKFC